MDAELQRHIDEFPDRILAEIEKADSRPRYDWSRGIYCDHHLSSRLLRSATYIAGRYGGDNADVHPLDHWRCPRPDCSRCYVVEMYGYFVLNRNRGSQIQPDPDQERPRCGRHEEVPYMAVIKIGTSRRYACLFQGCDRLGPVVAEDVTDVEDTLQTAASAPILKGDAKKQAEELATFTQFAEAAGLGVDPNSASNAKDPFPDIRCIINKSESWFELGRIQDTKLLETIDIQRRKGIAAPFEFSSREPLERIIKQKASKSYETNGRPVELVLHFDDQPPDRLALDRHLEMYATKLEALRRSGPFSRAWIFDGWSKTVLWKSAD